MGLMVPRCHLVKFQDIDTSCSALHCLWFLTDLPSFFTRFSPSEVTASTQAVSGAVVDPNARCPSCTPVERTLRFGPYLHTGLHTRFGPRIRWFVVVCVSPGRPASFTEHHTCNVVKGKDKKTNCYIYVYITI